MNDEERLEWIENASYRDLLEKLRFEPAGSPWFAGVVGRAFYAKWAQKKRETGPIEHAIASRNVGWGR